MHDPNWQPNTDALLCVGKMLNLFQNVRQEPECIENLKGIAKTTNRTQKCITLPICDERIHDYRVG